MRQWEFWRDASIAKTSLTLSVNLLSLKCVKAEVVGYQNCEEDKYCQEHSYQLALRDDRVLSPDAVVYLKCKYSSN